jgi:hypothetical protein
MAMASRGAWRSRALTLTVRARGGRGWRDSAGHQRMEVAVTLVLIDARGTQGGSKMDTESSGSGERPELGSLL